MTFPCKKLLLILSICIMPALVSAAETAPVADDQKPAQITTQTPTSPQKATETPKAQQSLRLGHADISRIGTETILGKTSQAQAKEKQQKFQTKIESRAKQLDKQKTAIEAKLAKLTPAQREVKAKEFQSKVEDFQKFGRNAEKEFQTFQDNLSKTLLEAIEQAAVDYGKVHGLALVVVKRDLLYLADGVNAQDVTDGIIKLLDEKSTKK